jgi:hypothetical protein
MRKFFTLALVVAAMGAVSIGCGSKGSGSTSTGGSGASGGGGAGGSGGMTTTTSSSSSSSTSMSTGNCADAFPTPSMCQQCGIDNCCAQISACTADTDCNTCLTDPMPDPNVCAANSQFSDLNTCVTESCAVECTPPSTCNPITNEGCNTAAGEACDFQSGGGYTCYPDGNTHKLCEPCGSAGDGNFCEGGMTCNKMCTKFCCDDGDCGTGTCNKDLTADPKVGICVAADMMAAACDAPLMSPSNGACFTIM